MNDIDELLNDRPRLYKLVDDGFERELLRQKKAGKKFLSDEAITNIVNSAIKEALGDNYSDDYTKEQQ